MLKMNYDLHIKYTLVGGFNLEKQYQIISFSYVKIIFDYGPQVYFLGSLFYLMLKGVNK